MCFSEFIGYTCGHSSAEVLRPCPMTTQFHANPLCSPHARRPLLAPEMCPACQRILHGRAVLIVEWEHRWMHERGACGCEVRFPDLVRPRVVGRSSSAQAAVETRRRGEAEGVGVGVCFYAEGGSDRAKGGRGDGRRAGETASQRIGGNDKAGAKKVPALYQETATGAMSGGSNKPEVATRVSSLYGAEWVDEHRQLHLRGSCRCPGDFSSYQAPTHYRSPFVHSNAHDQNVQMPGFESLQGHPFQSGPGIPQRSPGAIYVVDPARSTNSLYNFACLEGAKITSCCADFESVEFPRPEGVLPLVGLPIGAGPEGPAGLRHTGDFNDCVLDTKELLTALEDEACPLRHKSKSVACLRELKMTREHIPCVSLSAGGSNNGDGLPGKDQL